MDYLQTLLAAPEWKEAYIEASRDFGGWFTVSICVPLSRDDPRRDGFIGNIEHTGEGSTLNDAVIHAADSVVTHESDYPALW